MKISPLAGKPAPETSLGRSRPPITRRGARPPAPAFIVACFFVVGGLLAGVEGIVNRREFEAARHENGMLKLRQAALRGQIRLVAEELKALEGRPR